MVVIILIVVLVVTAIVILTGWVVMQQPQFGKQPGAERLKRMSQSPHYKDGVFENLSHTPSLAEGVSYYTVIKDFIFGKSKRNKPDTELPVVETDLHALPIDKDVLVWFGHSSYFMILGGKRILVDPVLSGHASPFSFSTKGFAGTDAYNSDDIPEIDYLFITHDHYDHLDYDTIAALRPKVKRVITALGVGEHLEYWGYNPVIITETDRYEQVVLDEGFVVDTAPARHFSGRRFKRNGTLWLSFIFTTPGRKIFIGGDSGYDTHFADIGREHGPFDLVILEDGQYNKYWKYIHMMPEEVVQAAIDLKGKRLLPVHWGKFALSLHAWDEPIIRVVNESKNKAMPLLHPMIGEVVHLDDMQPQSEWWVRG